MLVDKNETPKSFIMDRNKILRHITPSLAALQAAATSLPLHGAISLEQKHPKHAKSVNSSCGDNLKSLIYTSYYRLK
jgi:hypothetical protein